eukprot:2585191-Rhodomonas_salina.3
MQCPVLTKCMGLCPRYAMPGADRAYDATCRARSIGVHLTCYVAPRTSTRFFDPAHAICIQSSRSSVPRRLLCNMPIDKAVDAICLLHSDAACDTEIAHCGTSGA